jgi:hypothetical protein
MKIKIYLLWVLCASLLACDPGVEISPKDISKQYGVTCFLSPQDSFIKVYMYRGRALGQGVSIKDLVVSDAQIQIMSATQKVTLPYNPETFRYETEAKNLPIIAGQKYTLNVQATDGTLIKGACQIPKQAPAIKLETTLDGNNYNFTANWAEDAPNEVSQVFLALDYTYVPRLGSTEPLLRYNLPIKNLNQYIQIGGIENLKDSKDVWLVGSYTNFSSEMNRFLTSSRSDANINFSNDELIPNFTEPQPVYTNLTGGVGIFAGFTQGQSRLKIK